MAINLADILLPDERDPVVTRDYDAGVDQSDTQEDYRGDLLAAGYMPAPKDWNASFQQGKSGYRTPFAGTVKEAFDLMYPEHEVINDPKHGELVKLGPYQNTGIDYWDSDGKRAGAINAVKMGIMAAGAYGAGSAFAGEALNVADMGLEFDLWDAMGEGVIQTAAEEGAGVIASGAAEAFGPASMSTAEMAGTFGNVAASSMFPEAAGLTSGMAELGGTGLIAQAAGPELGLVDKVISWAKGNPLLASTTMNLAGGFIRGAMAPTPEEKAKAEKEAALELLAEKRKFGQTRNVGLPMQPSNAGPLRQATVPGLINGAMR